MIEKAFKYVERTVDIQAGRTVVQDEPVKPTGGGGGAEETSGVEQQMIADTRTAWTNNDADALRRASNDQYFFVYAPEGGVNVFKNNPQKYKDALAKYRKDKAAWDNLGNKARANTPAPTVPKAKDALAENIKGVDGLYPYFFGSGSTSMKKWNAELERQRSAGGGGTTAPNTPPVKFNGPK
jgi:hypothetical protein